MDTLEDMDQEEGLQYDTNSKYISSIKKRAVVSDENLLTSPQVDEVQNMLLQVDADPAVARLFETSLGSRPSFANQLKTRQF